MSEDPATITISSGSVLNAEEIAKKTFPPARRGVDPEAVRRYLEAIAGEVRTLGEREQALRRMLADAERRAAEPELDQATLTKAVGAETARVLQAAHEAAAGVVANGESRARELVEEAEQAASRRREAAEAAAKAMLDEAEGQASALSSSSEAAATTLREDTVAEVAALTEMTQAEAVSLLDSTKAECRQMLREARELRGTVLKDLGERRRALFVQLEQLRSGRDSLVEMVGDVGSVVDGLRERLAGAEHEARLAAAEAGERAT
ncbi:MAG: DivIVA domain-containing protein, partial [Acidimicrobiales bacterium]